uniref:DUF676 domain-containing protein n=1 Tax=Schistocephalus solidus TaxID=70667 RepID=A0A183SW72_SCHSO
LKTRLHGQHIAEERLYNHAHMDDRNPRKALVLSLHGFTGVGKNFASSIIVSNILRKGEKSRFYHFYDSTIHFPHEDLQVTVVRSVYSEDLNTTTFLYFLF